MQDKSKLYSEVQTLYELCTFSTDLKKFCKELGVDYEKYTKWRSRQLVNEEDGKPYEAPPPTMSSVTVTGIPIDKPEEDPEEDDMEDMEVDESVSKVVDVEKQLVRDHSGASHDGVPQIKGFDLKRTTLADVICAGRGLDMEIDSFKLHMHDGLHMRHTHITLREAIIILHQLNIMYSC